MLDISTEFGADSSSRWGGVRPDRFNLPRQHSLTHYIKLIWEYGSPNGLCSSITESKHIKAVKEPWRCSSRFEALPQILLTNQCLDKLAASRADFAKRGMLNGIGLMLAWQQILSNVDEDEDDEDDGNVAGPKVEAYVDLVKTPCKCYYTEFILTTLPLKSNNQTLPSSYDNSSMTKNLPLFYQKITVYPSAVATFHAPSDISGVGGMRCECIRAVESWRKGPGHYDTVFVNVDPSAEDDKMGMWIVKPVADGLGSEPCATVLHLDTIVQGAHLLPVFGCRHTLDRFTSFYVNKYADHHSFEIAF
ncbi:hypothetical protein BJV77DRAFT_1061409 [Russula vinacea]|nr:hypothetical protein BJV77DRAFT_1061409 [Russula vinacea]